MLRGIAWGGLIAGVLDISYAITANMLAGRPASRTLQSVASGLLGRAAFQGGWQTAALGLLLHFVIAFGAAAMYFAVSRKVPLLLDRATLCGLFFGAVVYLMMNRVIVPLSAAPFTLPMQAAGLFVHMFFVGLPIALAIRAFSR